MGDNKSESNDWGCVVILVALMVCLTVYEIAKMYK